MNNNQWHSENRVYITFVLLFFLTALIYSNSFHASWQLDDYQNIVDNPEIRIADLSINQIKKSFYASPGRDDIYRPLPFLTFSLNWYFHQYEITGYHIINFAIHFFASFILFLTIINILSAPNVIKEYKSDAFFIATLSAVLWAIHPIQTQAVTYIVQRMASMAAFFYLFGLYSYIKARLSQTTGKQIIFFSLSGFFFLLAVYSKQNAVIFPFILFLIEFVFFQKPIKAESKKYIISYIVGVVVIFLILLLFLLHGSALVNILKGYQNTPFNPIQRLLTEFRALIIYLYQIVYPNPESLNIVHDIEISNSLFQPWTTLPSIIFIILLISIGVYLSYKRSIIGFAVLFYFMNHIIESSVLPLDIIYEHRNYLPSLFLFVPAAIGIKKLLDYYNHKNKIMRSIIISATSALILLMGIGTYVRNMAWSSEKNLWEDAMQKSPNQALPYQYLAVAYYEKIGNFDKAIEFYEKSITLKNNNIYDTAFAYFNLGWIYAEKKNDYANALNLINKSLQILPSLHSAHRKLSLIYIKQKQYTEAMHHIDYLVGKNLSDSEMIRLKGIVLLKQEKYQDALVCFRKCIKMEKFNWVNYMYIGITFYKLNYNKTGFWFLKRAYSLKPEQAIVLLFLAENQLLAGNNEESEKYIELFLNKINIQKINSFLNNLNSDYLIPQLNIEKLVPIISSKIEQKTKTL